MPSLITFLTCIGAATASMPGLWRRQATFSGIATFNDFATQSGISGTVCGAKAGMFTSVGHMRSPEKSSAKIRLLITITSCRRGWNFRRCCRRHFARYLRWSVSGQHRPVSMRWTIPHPRICSSVMSNW